MYDPAVLDISDDDIINSFAQGIKNVAALSVETGLPTVASVPYSILLGFANLLAVAVETDYTFKQAEAIKAFIENPEAFASAAPETTADAPAADAPAAAPVEESPDEDVGGAGMFDEDY